MKGKYYFCGQSPRPADFSAGLFPTFHFCYCCVLFLNHSPYFLSANNEHWLTHTLGNYLLKEVKVNAELIIVYLDWICPLNWTLVVERKNVSEAGVSCSAQTIPKHTPTGPSRALEANRTLYGPWKKQSQAVLSKGASHGMSWGARSVQMGWCIGSS